MIISEDKLKLRRYKPLLDKDGDWVTADIRGVGKISWKGWKYGARHYIRHMTISPAGPGKVFDKVSNKEYILSGNSLGNLIKALSSKFATVGHEENTLEVHCVQVKHGSSYMLDFVSEVIDES